MKLRLPHMKLMPFALAAATLITAPILPAADTPDLKALTLQAEGGDAAAQVALAVRYRDGKGIAKDDALALQWAHRAADEGNAEAMDFIGFAYLRGAVVKRNPGIAFGYFQAAAEQSAQAAFNLGQCFFGAQGTEQDCPKALDWWKKFRDATLPVFTELYTCGHFSNWVCRRWRCFPAKASRLMRRRHVAWPSGRQS